MALVDSVEVARHNTKEDCWVVINGRVWDVTDFLDEHPGGAHVVYRYAGQDATKAYDEIHDPDLVVSTLAPFKCKGAIRPDSITSSSAAAEAAAAAAAVQGKLQAKEITATPSALSSAKTSTYPPLWSIINIADFETVAKTYLSPTGWAYYAGGAEDEISLSDTRRLFRKITFRPRVLRRVEPIDTSVNILGYKSSLPFYISPTGQGRFACRDAESVLARAAGKQGVIYCMPTSASYEAVFAAARSDQNRDQTRDHTPLFFQLYTTRQREKAQATIRRLESLGAKALFLTVDSPVIGRREKDERVKVADGGEVASSSVAKTGSMGLLNPFLSWDDLSWIRETTSMPLVLKGVQTVEDAVLAYEHGVQGIVLSNHGGRSLDTAQAPIVTLLEIRKHAPHLLSAEVREKKFQVFLDGGIRRGTDILKALALGATAVGIGRPFLYSMTAGYGEEGVAKLLQLLRAEIETSMALAGAPTVKDLVPEMINSERAENEMSRRIKL